MLAWGFGDVQGGGVEPYRIEVPDRELERLRLRLADARWPDRETVEDWSQGVPLQVVRDLCDYWRRGYDWRATEQRVNRWRQYLAVVDGVPIHLFHLPSPSRSAVPLILTHGWPGSFFEFEQVMPQLSDPVASADTSSPAFHVVVPSLPHKRDPCRYCCHGIRLHASKQPGRLTGQRSSYDNARINLR